MIPNMEIEPNQDLRQATDAGFAEFVENEAPLYKVFRHKVPQIIVERPFEEGINYDPFAQPKRQGKIHKSGAFLCKLATAASARFSPQKLSFAGVYIAHSLNSLFDRNRTKP